MIGAWAKKRWRTAGRRADEEATCTLRARGAGPPLAPRADGLETRRWNGTKSAFADCTSETAESPLPQGILGHGRATLPTLTETSS